LWIYAVVYLSLQLKFNEKIAMTSTMDIRNRIIEQLLAINDKEYLLALSRIIDQSQVQGGQVPLTEEQKLMLAMSDADIAERRTIDQQALHEQELRWLKEK
jgi:hypothetical protein